MTKTTLDDITNRILDALVVGAGFSGIYQLHCLHKLGLDVKGVEAGGDIGGTWYWNCYPGARVDSDAPVYQFSVEELWKDWQFSERFPDREEIRRYFRYIDKKLDVSRDICFNTRIVAAEFDGTGNFWQVTTEKGARIRARFLLMCLGFASKPYIPPLEGLDTFKGACHHTALWPQDGVELNGKRIGVIGTGASGVQIIEEASKIAKELTVFQRTPNLAIPMCQSPKAEKSRDIYPGIFETRRQTFGGFHVSFVDKLTFDDSEEDRRSFYEKLWNAGGLQFWLGSYKDSLIDDAANDEAYTFWRDQVRARIHNDAVKEKLAPATKIHPWGTKRPALEQQYYEVFNQPNVALVDLNEKPITRITPKGIRTSDGMEHELDVLVLATGFDALTGGFTQLDIKGTDGVLLRDKWAAGVKSHLGLAIANFPNMFYTYGPQSPTAFCNGLTCVEAQVQWITECIKYMQDRGFKRIEASEDAEASWAKRVQDLGSLGLWYRAKSWYLGANIPGKAVEPLNFTGGYVAYQDACKECADGGYKGFILS